MKEGYHSPYFTDKESEAQEKLSAHSHTMLDLNPGLDDFKTPVSIPI